MGCVSSTLLDHDDDFTQLGGGSRFRHHIVSLTSSTYGLLTIDPHPPSAPTPPRYRSDPEVINSWELMADLDSESSRFSSPAPLSLKPHSSSLLHTVAELDSRIAKSPKLFNTSNTTNKENSNPNVGIGITSRATATPKVLVASQNPRFSFAIEEFEKLCPPGGEDKVVIYTTSLRGVRKTFEACNAVRAAMEGMGVAVSERDISMHNGYKEELKELMKGVKNGGGLIPPKVFVKGRYIGGVEEVLRINEEGCLGKLLEGVPKAKVGVVCQGCGGVGFLPCFECNGSCKVFEEKQGRNVVVRCGECNENGLVLCPLCS